MKTVTKKYAWIWLRGHQANRKDNNIFINNTIKLKLKKAKWTHIWKRQTIMRQKLMIKKVNKFNHKQYRQGETIRHQTQKQRQNEKKDT